MISMEDEKIRNMPRKWSKGKDSLTELFGRKRIKSELLIRPQGIS
jgi:hypothetical protein